MPSEQQTVMLGVATATTGGAIAAPNFCTKISPAPFELIIKSGSNGLKLGEI